MNRSTALSRKLIYLAVLIAMLVPLYMLGQPAAGVNDPGGSLSQMRLQYNIAESDLGEISPASETMKLACLGLRGFAGTLLWRKSHEFKMAHEWDRLKATLNYIALLQPHYDRVWEHQAHNLAYNVSTEFDDYRQRYEMVREGTEYLTRGVRQNKRATRLIWYTGWFYGAKMGMSDEKQQFRQLYADDSVLHASLLDQGIAIDSPEARGPLDKPDNWLTGRLWLNRGYDLVDSGISIHRQTPLNFFETGPKWRMRHAEAIEDEGILDERAQNAWQMALDDWLRFGQRSVPTTASYTVKLDQLDELTRQKGERTEEFIELTKDVYMVERQKLLDAMTPEMRALRERPIAELNFDDMQARLVLDQSLQPNLAAVAKLCDESIRLKAVNLVGEIEDLTERAAKTDGYRNQINYGYWKTLAQAEQEERTVEARRLVYEAEQANANAELDKAIDLYYQSFKIWAEIFDDYPILTIDDSAQDLFESIRRYMIAIDSNMLPEDFPLNEFIGMVGRHQGRVDQFQFEEIKARAEEDAIARAKELEMEEREAEQRVLNADQESANSDTEAESEEPDSEDDTSEDDASQSESPDVDSPDDDSSADD